MKRPPPDKRQKVRKTCFYVETVRRKNATDLVQNQSCEVMRLDRCCCPIALSIVVESLLKGQFLESDGNPKVVFTCARQML